MLKFKTLRWQNFLSTGQYFNEVYLDKYDRTLVSGENGAGKSTVLDALTYALYGKSFRGINIKNLINSINEKNCVVEVEFISGGSDYIVRRGMKPKIFEIEKDGVVLDQDAKSADTQQLLEDQILKMSYKAFCQVVILGSSNYTPFMKLSAGDRRNVVENLLDINIFSLINDILKKRLTTIKDKLNLVKNTLIGYEAKIKSHERVLETLELKKNESITSKKEEIKELNKKIKKLESKIESLTEKKESLLFLILDQDSVEKMLIRSEKIKEDLDSKIKTIGRENKFYEDNNHCPTCEQKIDVGFKEKAVESNSEKIIKYEEAIKEILDVINDSEEKVNRFNEISSDASDINVQVLENKSAISHNNKLVEKYEIEIKKSLGHGESFTRETNLLKEATKKYNKVKEENDELVRDKNDLDIIAELLKDGGIKAKIIKHYLPIMNNYINKFLSQMGLFCQFTLDEQFNETILARHRDNFSYNNFSEGERLRIDLSFLFTWREISRLKNSVSCNLLILDEVFDSSLDGVGTEEFMKIIRTMGDRSNVFIISHKADQISDSFRNHITFKKKGNFSEMTFMDRNDVKD